MCWCSSGSNRSLHEGLPATDVFPSESTTSLTQEPESIDMPGICSVRARNVFSYRARVAQMPSATGDHSCFGRRGVYLPKSNCVQEQHAQTCTGRHAPDRSQRCLLCSVLTEPQAEPPGTSSLARLDYQLCTRLIEPAGCRAQATMQASV